MRRLCVFFVFVFPSSSYCAWRFLCLFLFCFVFAFAFSLCAARERVSSGRFSIFWGVWHRSHIAFLGRDIISLGGRVAEINQSTNQPYLFVLFQNLAPLLEGGLQGRKMKGEQNNTSKK